MNVEKYIISKEIIELEIDGITLLSKDEYLKFKDNIPAVNFWWWLRSPGYGGCNASCVDYGGGVGGYGSHVILSGGSVRPALNLKSNNLSISERFEFGGYDWTMIGDNIALCDTSICEMAFRKDYLANDATLYEQSDIKSYLYNWLKKQESGVGF